MKLLNAGQRLKLKSKIVLEKTTTLIPTLMKEHDIDMWIVSDNDEMMKVLLKEPSNGNTTLVFINVDNEYKCYQNIRHIDPPYNALLEQGESVEDAIKRLIETSKPKNIALNMSKEFAQLDGASYTLYKKVKSVCGDIEIISAQGLAMDVSQIRTDDELEIYEVAASFARNLIKVAMSKEIITPGVTTNLEVRDYMLQKYQENGLIRTWGPNVDMQRQGEKSPMIGMADTKEVIQKGDLLHIDFGFEYVGLHTDMQYLAYVLKDGESEAPASLIEGFEKCYEFQQIYMDVVKPGITGNEARREIMKRAMEKGLDSMVYSHPIGHSVHSVGPSIGRFGQPADIPQGEYTIKEKTCFAMEQNVKVDVAEWDNQKVFIFREEDVVVKDNKVEVIGELQEKLLLI